MALPYTVYTVKNESSRGANIFLGIASLANNINTKDYFPNQVSACKTTYLFATVAGTRNVKITRPTTTDPYVYIQTRQVSPKQCPDNPATSLMKSGDSSGIVMRTFSSDSSVIIEDLGCNYGLNTYTYDVENVCSINGLFYRTIGTPGRSNVVWQFKDIVAENCVAIEQNGPVMTFDGAGIGACCPQLPD